MKFALDGNAGLAILVIALVLSALTLFVYWQTLRRESRSVRLLLIGLRGLSFVLLALILAGLSIQYERTAPLRVGIRSLPAPAPPQSNSDAAALIRLLKAKNIEAMPIEAGRMADARAVDAEIILTDGNIDAGSVRNELRGISAASGGAPIFIVTKQSAAGRPNVVLEGVKVASHPRRGVPLQIQCRVRGIQMQGRESLLTISDAAKVQASTSVRWTGDYEWQTVALELVPKVAGWNDYVARIEAPAGGDSQLVSRPFTLQASEQRVRVLFVEGEPTWEAKFIRRALEQSELFTIDYFAQVSRVAAAGEISSGEKDPASSDDAGAPRSNLRPEAKLHSVLRSGLNNYDLLIAGPMSGAMLSASEAANVRAWVERRGGGLIVLGGNSFAGSIAAPHGGLYDLMPAEASPRGFAREISTSAPISAGSNDGKEQKDGGIHLTPTLSAANGVLRAYWEANRAAGNNSNQLSGEGFRLATLRPGAKVLAVSGDANAARVSQPSNATEPAGPPLIAAMRYGAGQVVAFAPADSWRIGTNAGESSNEAVRPFDALWQGLALWTSSQAGPPVEISLSSESPAVYEPVTVEVQVRDEKFQTVPLTSVAARLQRLADASDTESPASLGVAKTTQQQASALLHFREVGFSPAAEDGSVWRANFAAPPAGRYRLTIDYSFKGNNPRELSGTFWKEFGTVASSLSSTVSPDTLQRLARETGGDFYANANADELMKRLALLSQSRIAKRETLDLRRWWPLVLILPLLLSTEWLLRRLSEPPNDC